MLGRCLLLLCLLGLGSGLSLLRRPSETPALAASSASPSVAASKTGPSSEALKAERTATSRGLGPSVFRFKSFRANKGLSAQSLKTKLALLNKARKSSQATPPPLRPSKLRESELAMLRARLKHRMRSFNMRTSHSKERGWPEPKTWSRAKPTAQRDPKRPTSLTATLFRMFGRNVVVIR